VVYGSRVKWTARPNSNLDLVAFATPAQRPQMAELKDTMAESNLPFPAYDSLALSLSKRAISHTPYALSPNPGGVISR
jgi:hypothetical protein